MSFEIFNYAPTLHEIDRIILAVRERMLVSTRRQIDILTSETAARVLVGERARLDNALAADGEIVEELEAMIVRINTMRALPESIKAKLYNVYCQLAAGVISDDGSMVGVANVGMGAAANTVSIGSFAERLPICYEGLLIDAVPIADKIRMCSQGAENAVFTLRAELRRVYKKYELLTLPRHYRWVEPEGML